VKLLLMTAIKHVIFIEEYTSPIDARNLFLRNSSHMWVSLAILTSANTTVFENTHA
jgi:hypothetical protein